MPPKPITLKRQVNKLNLAALVCVTAFRMQPVYIWADFLVVKTEEMVVIVRAVAYKLVDGCELHMSK